MNRSTMDKNIETITPREIYNHGSWSTEETEKFSRGLKQFGKQWKAIASILTTRSVITPESEGSNSNQN